MSDGRNWKPFFFWLMVFTPAFLPTVSCVLPISIIKSNQQSGTAPQTRPNLQNGKQMLYSYHKHLCVRSFTCT